MQCEDHQVEISRLRAELAREREERAHDRARIQRMEDERAELVATLRTQAEALVTLAGDARTVTAHRHRSPSAVTSTVTKEEKKQKQLEQGRRKTADWRLRQEARDRQLSLHGHTPGYSSSPPPPNASESRGTLSVVTVAARDGHRHGDGNQTLKIHRTPDTLPAEVRSLQAAWNELVAPHGFEAWEQTSAQLVRDAQEALALRPLEEWRKVFELVPRSRVCRGEYLDSRKASVLYILKGRDKEGNTCAEKLLSGYWQIDPLPQAETPTHEPGDIIDLGHLEASAAGEAALSAWQHVIGLMRTTGRRETLKHIDRIAPATVRNGELVLVCPDKYARTLVEDHYLAALTDHVRPLGINSVYLALPVWASPNGGQDEPPEPEPGAGAL